MKKLVPRVSLRLMLTVPYVVLVLIAALTIGVLSYRAGSEAVDTLSDRVLRETVDRIDQAVNKHVSGSEAVLETAFPAGLSAPASVKNDLASLRTRFWLATSIHLDPNNYAYYGNRQGQFMGLWRYSQTEAELRLITEPDANRTIYRFNGINGDLKDPVIESRKYDPRERPWYKTGQSSANQTWTSIYIDFKTLELVGTRARRVNDGQGQFEGVVATDLSLAHLNDFLKKLPLSSNGFAFIVEPDGNLIATSRGPHLKKGLGEDNARLSAALSEDPLIAATYKKVKELTVAADSRQGGDRGDSQTSSFIGPNGEIIQAGYSTLRDKAGLNWIVAVAVPRNDFMQKVTDNLQRTAWLALLACVLIAVTGMVVLNVIAKDLQSLADAARKMGDGHFDNHISLDRDDEIGELAKSFAAMQTQLFTDRLTGIPNREAMIRRIEDRIVTQRRSGDNHPFAVLFLDLNGFKAINDRFGHDVGDKVLTEISQRLTANLRDTDMAARYGGDEFVVLLENVPNHDGAARARDKLERALSAPLQSLQGIAADGQPLTVGASIGIALCPDEGHDMQTLLKRADEDMYLRKQASVGGRV